MPSDAMVATAAADAAIGNENEDDAKMAAAATSPEYPDAMPYYSSSNNLPELCMEAQVVAKQSKSFSHDINNSTACFGNNSGNNNNNDDDLGKDDSNSRGKFSFSPNWFVYTMIAMTLIFLALVGYGFGSGLFLPSKSAISSGSTTNDPSKYNPYASSSSSSSSSTSSNSNGDNVKNNRQDRQDYKYNIGTLLGLPMVMERTSPQARAVEWLAYQDQPLFDVSVESSYTYEEEEIHKALLEQRYALVVWYYDQGGPTVWKTLNRDESAGWIAFGAGMHECNWKGVDCDYKSVNIGVDGNSNNDRGTVVGLRLSPALGLVLTGTHLSTELGLLTALRRMDFSSQRLQGTIPDEWASMTNLETVILSKNQLQTRIPEWIGRSSEAGGGWSTLQQLALDGNFLYGNLPSSLSNLRRLTHLELQVNPQLEGRFDETLFWQEQNDGDDTNANANANANANTNNLEFLDLSNTGLKGKLPGITLPAIRFFRLWNMPGFWGTLPREIGTWSNLETFSIREMPGLTGTLPTEFGALQKLRTLEVLDSNFMSGELPTELGNLSSNLKTINFRYTNQTGTLPAEWSSLVNLETINLMQNGQLTGTIPTEYAYMTSLRFLDLRGTDLSGEVSQEICAIESIEEFQADCSYKNDKNVGKIMCACCVWCHNS
mmetsp:Transcript_23824/g.48930  ORF Transcript_23824/g.48930 Transcript_23824/m.48930 type:complete len:659 (-) Transcript_23824:2590-4566(-)